MLIYTSYPKCWFTRHILNAHLHVLSLKLYWTKQADDANKIFYLTLSHFEMRSARKSKENESTSSRHTLTTHPTCRACLLAALAPATTSRHTHTTCPTCHAKKPLKPLNNAHFNDTIWLIWTSFTKTSTKQNKLAYSTLSFRPNVLSMYSTSNSFDVLAFGEL